MARDTVVDRLKRHAQARGGEPALYSQDKPGAPWRALTWSQYWEQASKFGAALLALGYEPGEAVAIMGNNCPRWVLADVGALVARAVPAGVYQTSTPEQVAYIVTHCEARVFVVEDEAMWQRLAPVYDQLASVERVVLMRGATQDKRVVSFEDFLASGASGLSSVAASVDAIADTDLATIIYTSGTTGHPKGAMLSHANMSWTASTAAELVGGLGPQDCIVSYLPLSHIAEQMFTIHGPLTGGCPVWFCEDMKRLKEVLVAARPTVFLGVPRVWEKFKAALEGKLAEARGVKAKIVSWARGVGLRAGEHRHESGAPTGLLGVQEALARRLFFSKLRAQLGLDRLRVAVVGAAPIGRDVMEFFLSCGIPIQEVYGQSEGCGPTTFNRPQPGWTRLGTVGRPIPGVTVKLAQDGEILFKGPNVFMGYYKNPEATAETLIDGWLHTGDVGEFDDAGFLRITDRKKELIITAGGKNVSPQNVEKLLRAIPGIGNAAAIGDKRRFVSAILTLDPERAPQLAREQGWPEQLAALAVHPPFLKWLGAQIDALNGKLARYEQIRKWHLLAEDFSVDGGELTPTQKLKRRVIEQKYADIIEGFYKDEAGSGW
jgi:long-chain acyl-CoA synthetase